MEAKPDIHWLDDESYAKAVGQLRLQLNSVFKDFHQYGLDVYVPGAIAACVKLAEDFSLRTRGIDHPIVLKR